MKRKNGKALKLLFEAIWLYSTAVWAYIAIENLIYPSMVYSSDFSYYIPIKTNLLALISFVISFLFYLLWRFYTSQ
ncbi:MAG: hypothetical protein ACP5MV_04295 [Candidatus Parvarchaeum sp.]